MTILRMEEIVLNTLTAMLFIIINNAFVKDTSYEIALELLRSRHKLAQVSASTLAKTCQTSVASVNKFCTMLGVQSFAELKLLMSNSFDVREEQMSFRLAKMNEEDILSSIQYHANSEFNLETFKQSVYHLVEIMSESSEIALVGAHFPTSLAINCQEDMIIMDKFMYILPQNRDIAVSPLSPETLVILISLTGKIYEFNKTNFDAICQNNANIAILSSFEDYPKYQSIKEIIKIPVDDDNEVGNILILEIFRYIKFVYYHEKYKGAK